MTELCEPSHKKQKVGSRMLQRLQPQDSPRFSDIDRYFGSARAEKAKINKIKLAEKTKKFFEVSDMEDQNGLCDWWKVHKKEYPRMAAAARDYLAIPASEVSVERLFNTGRDVLGVRRFSMKGETLRILMLLDDMYK